MESKVLICPRTFEAWAKMHTNDQGKSRVEIVAPQLIKRFNERGMRVPLYLQTKEMKESDINFLKLEDLEKNPDFFTEVFQKTVCKTQLLKERFYWKSVDEYIDAATEKRKNEEVHERTMIFLTNLSEKARLKGTTLAQEFFGEDEKETLEIKQLPIPSSSRETSTEYIDC
ncbi:MAG: hypothetical protein QRY71_00250 [Candidatus Rhabdochlamydia sp.]